MRFLFLDPGDTTGWFSLQDGQHDALELPAEEAIQRLATVEGLDAIVVEDYRPVRTTNIVPAEVIGAARCAAARIGSEFYRYSPAQAKTFAPNRVLARLGWHDPTQPHASDAARLAICFGLLDADPSGALARQVRSAKMAGEA